MKCTILSLTFKTAEFYKESPLKKFKVSDVPKIVFRFSKITPRQIAFWTKIFTPGQNLQARIKGEGIAEKVTEKSPGVNIYGPKTNLAGGRGFS